MFFKNEVKRELECLFDLSNKISELIRDASSKLYGVARDTMYKGVYRDPEGYVHCGYTDNIVTLATIPYKVFLPLDVDPISAI